MGDDFDEKVKKTIPANWHMFSGSQDSQTSADVQNTGKFSLPDPAGKAGGACTSALLKVLYGNSDLTWVQCLRLMRTELSNMGFDQIPQLSSSRLTNVDEPMVIVPKDVTGTKRALLIGINYTGMQGELSGCHNDVGNIKKYLIDNCGFNESEMLILMDDGEHHAPTRRNIIGGFQKLIEYAKAGDVVFVHYSGHGGFVRDTSGDEDDGYDETLIPLDFKEKGMIVDDDILDILVKPMPAGVTCTVLMDCCHSGTVLDLPYRFSADDSKMRRDNAFKKFPPAEEACCACLC